MSNKRNNLLRREDAITEVLDFTITLGVMLLAVAIIGVAGYPMISHMKEMGHIENMEQGFSVLKLNMNKIADGKTPSQSVELKMYGGKVAVSGTSYINVSMQVWNESISANEILSVERQMRMIENEFKDTSIGYENTAVWTKYPQGKAVAISEPEFASDDRTLIIPMVTISGLDGVSGSSLIRVVSNGGQLSINRFENVSQVNVTIGSDYYEGWERYLNGNIGMQITDVDTSNNTVSASKDYDPGIDVLLAISPMSVTVE
ncbi:hypothetical protein V7O66_11710 [Methanolobus sp. ZRKC3]|uniref:DUF7289 family protein n=1 Tax=Methanolobus sp. ZRKC3 TaxID=3125786 RepID=UPI003249E1C8